MKYTKNLPRDLTGGAWRDPPTLGLRVIRSDSKRTGCGEPCLHTSIHSFASHALLPFDLPPYVNLEEDILEEVAGNTKYFSKPSMISKLCVDFGQELHHITSGFQAHGAPF